MDRRPRGSRECLLSVSRRERKGVEIRVLSPKTEHYPVEIGYLGVFGQNVILCGRASGARSETERNRCEQYGQKFAAVASHCRGASLGVQQL